MGGSARARGRISEEEEFVVNIVVVVLYLAECVLHSMLNNGFVDRPLIMQSIIVGRNDEKRAEPAAGLCVFRTIGAFVTTSLCCDITKVSLNN